jgi:predicted nuclease of predicted toxin-antitoxin system
VRFLADQDVYALTVRFLRELGHDVLTAAEAGLSRAGDSVLLTRAKQENPIMVTRDKDYGGLVFVNRMAGGVILLRVTPGTLQATHERLALVLKSYAESELASAFVVVEPGQHRFRKLQTTD